MFRDFVCRFLWLFLNTKMKSTTSLLIPSISFYCIISGMSLNGVAILVTLFAVSVLIYLKNQAPPTENVESVLGTKSIQVIAHRGGATDAPENTLEAIRLAHKNGADGVELDLEFSSDGVCVLIHDDTMERTTNATGPVKNFTYEQMKTLDASANHPLKATFPNARIPTCEEALKLSLELGLKIYLDVKGNAEQAVPAILELYKKHPALYKNAIVCSFWPQISYLVRRSDPKIVAALTHRSEYFTRKSDGREGAPASILRRVYSQVYDAIIAWGIRHWMWDLVGASALLIIRDNLDKQTVEYFRDRGVRVVVWTPNTAHEKAYFGNTLGVSYITDTLGTSHLED